MSEGDRYIGKTVADLQAEVDLDQVRQLHLQMDEVEKRIKALNEKHGITPLKQEEPLKQDQPFPFTQIFLGLTFFAAFWGTVFYFLGH
jgi:hypothetical protein